MAGRTFLASWHFRAARMLAGLTQADLARAAGCHPRSVRYWENKGSNPPTNVASTLDSIEQALNRHSVIPFSTPNTMSSIAFSAIKSERPLWNVSDNPCPHSKTHAMKHSPKHSIIFQHDSISLVIFG